MLSDFVFVEDRCSRVAIDWTTQVLSLARNLTWTIYRFLSVVARDQCVLVIVELLVGA